ncbi:MAG: 5-amino-6-(D-ribitylamino)uracil--L-tyrosine 4-hydroxyphenyl transferase CofH [Chloroflexi bacterium]|nr:5-amino-6-(D-ribitylamino)uracil--L-tyrosine 4-hydroxyphenyl transferase CofH [Chloroflexota bacterium]
MNGTTRDILAAALDGRNPAPAQALTLARETDLGPLLETAATLRDRGHGNLISYSRKVFIPLTQLCRDVCHYCTFAHPPKPGQRAYMTPEEVLEIARAGAAAGCHEALFTLGDKPELRYKVASRELAEMGHPTTISYLTAMAELVLKETGLLPHANPGVMTRDEIAALRKVTVSQGIMLESASERLCQKGGVHYGSPDKRPSVRLETMRHAGELAVPFTSGILIGIGETREERVDALLALRGLHEEFGHIQEIIVQNFRAKDGTKMAAAPEPDLDDLLWTIAVARIIFGAEMNIQAPPNLSYDEYPRLVAAGLNDWGGVSPVTPDHVNPEAPWPHLDHLRRNTAACGKELVERLAVYPAYNQDLARWQDEALRTPVLRAIDGDGFARTGAWSPGIAMEVPARYAALAHGPLASPKGTAVAPIIERALAGEDLTEADIERLFRARGPEFDAVCAAADSLRRQVNGDVVTYVVNRNINYTNICYFRCQFCAFSKGKLSENLRGQPYDLGTDEISRRAIEAWGRGATEVCMQGGIHPEYTGETYLAITRAVRDAVPGMHIHAFSPLEVWQGAATLGIGLDEYLGRLKEAGLGTLPGTAAEVLDDEVRTILCPDKLTTAQWFEVMEAAHRAGYRTTATIMYGHVDGPRNWARHLSRLRDLQKKTGGFTEFVPLPFVHMEAPIYLKGRARKGPTFREAVLMHAVARLALHPHITNIQVSWVKMGPEGVKACLNAGCNDTGGTLMNESITRAAGTEHGQEMPPAEMDALIRSVGRVPRQRSTPYGTPPAEQVQRSYQAPELTPVVLTPARKWQRDGELELVRN